MQQPYLLSSSQRIRHWKTFRTTLNETLTDVEQLVSAMKYWYQYPLVDRYIDPYDPKRWLTPWEFLHENKFCRSSLAYMMKQTLLLGEDERWSDDRLKLMYIDDKELSSEFIIVVADNKYVINYDLDKVIKFDFIQKNCIIRHQYFARNNVHCIV